MYVKSLRLAGFKSFADSTALEFEPGLNVIVGPNGSGKSNIADAISWVLGSQAPSSLRSGSMEDVIFAGSQERVRLGRTEVELTLDNASGVLPLALSEVTISRYGDRAGASEYSINGAPCRLLDISELLSDTGVGRSLHTLVGQGQLDQVLHAHAKERRAFIEEAAQIGKYRRRKDRSLHKIAKVEDGLVRLGDVLTELRRAIRPLKRQASAAEAYSELVSEHRLLRQRLAATDLHKLALEDAELDFASQELRTANAGRDLAELRARLTAGGEGRAAMVEDADTAQSLAHRMARTADRFTSLGRIAGERSERLAARLAAETEEGYRERIRLFDADARRWEAEEGGLAEAETSARSTAAEAHDQAAGDRREAEAAEARLVEARRAETQAAQALVRAEGSAAAGAATIGSFEARVAAVLDRKRVAEQSLAVDSGTIAEAEAEVRALESGLDEITEAAAAAEAALEEERTRADGLGDRLGTSRSDRAAAGARLEALDDVGALFADQPAVLERLKPLRMAAAERSRLADAGADEAARILAEAQARTEERWRTVARLDEELRARDALLAGAADRLSGRRRDHERRETELGALNDELSRVREALAAAARAAVEERAALPPRRSAAQEARRRLDDAERSAEAGRGRADSSLAAARDAEIWARGAEERRLSARLRVEEAEEGAADAQRALEGLADLRDSLRGAQLRTRLAGETATWIAKRAATWVADAQGRAAAARTRVRASDDELERLRGRERALESEVEEAQRHRNEVEVRRAEMRARSAAIAERALDEWGLSSSDLESLHSLEASAEAAARDRARELERAMGRLGAVNPRAGEEFAEARERETFLVAQIADLDASRRDLLKIVAEVDQTIVEVFSTAYEEVAREFEVVFERLFPGGTGRLSLTEPADVLGSGIEIEARPAGKSVKKLSLLSGGERSLVALAFLLAIFRARPSPFYLLDEVEAALDDVNLQRFIGLLAELEERAQILVVTHQKRTMEAASVLYGVTMAADGVSQVVARRMSDRPAVALRSPDPVLTTND